MPTYEYECKKCHSHFDAFPKMTDPPLEICPESGGEVQRLLGAGAAIIFKGSGFHATDFSSSQPSCGRDRPCCGRDEPCEKKPCNE
ncbi:MAG: zinc ribbon domain-containing protein [Candidatus Omnitrophica bacterium]|nr:zinc ribbon domain-containing protein [Candidatus Omnitrophota bacterium]